MQRFHNVLMVGLGVLVLFSLIGVSVKQEGENRRYSVFLKTEPNFTLVHR